MRDTSGQIFQQLKKEFTAIFKQLVPRGRGHLEVVDHGGQDAKGVKLRVLFDSPDETRGVINNSMNLSPGQKTIVALTFLLSLQKCFPSPFYCFDEIDADLDSHYQTVVWDQY